MIRLEELLMFMVKEGSSDLILKTGACPAVRVNGKVRFISDQPLPSEFTNKYLETLVTKAGAEAFRVRGALDRAVAIEGVGRFRCNIFRQSGRVAYVFRHVQETVPNFKELHLPVEQLQNLANLQRGMVLATGVAGSGKSTTLAAMIDFVNRSSPKHIITIEDPIEFLFEDKMSLINQREIGTDAPGFAEALKQSLRQAPDIIMIGEMRDKETAEAALSAAETGHLVFSTLHTVNAVQTVERIISFFPPHQHDLIRLQLSLNLAGVISLRLIQLKNGQGLMPACELLMSTPTVRDLLEEGKTRNLPKALEEGSYYGTLTFNQSLVRLFESGNIDYEEAISASDNPDELKMQIRGITRGTVQLQG